MRVRSSENKKKKKELQKVVRKKREGVGVGAQ